MSCAHWWNDILGVDVDVVSEGGLLDQDGAIRRDLRALWAESMPNGSATSLMRPVLLRSSLHLSPQETQAGSLLPRTTARPGEAGAHPSSRGDP